MAIHFNNGFGQLYEKDIDKAIANVNYHLVETDATKYTRKKWWGDFQSSKKLKELQIVGTLRIEFDDGRNGECIVWLGTEAGSKKSSVNIYRFSGRGKLGKGGGTV